MYKRGGLLGLQTGLVVNGDSPASTLTSMNFLRELAITRTINRETPAYLRYLEWLALRQVALDRIAGVQIEFDVDFSEFPILLCNLWGMPTVSGATKLWTDRGGATRKALTVGRITEHATEWDRVTDAWITEMNITGDPKGQLHGTASLVGLLEPPLTSGKPTWAPTTPPDRSPISGWGNVITRNGTAECFESFGLKLRNAVSPRFCSPAALPTSSTPEGAIPRAWEFAGLSGTVDGMLSYSDYSGSALERYLTGAQDALVAHATDPYTTGLSYTPGSLLTLPAVGWDKADEDYKKSPVSLTASGTIDDSPAAGFAASWAFTNPITYAGS